MWPYMFIGTKFRKVTKIGSLEQVTMMLECNLEDTVQCFCLNASKSRRTCISSHETRVHRVAQGVQATHPSSATILGICGLE